jgi:hypothetical protein
LVVGIIAILLATTFLPNVTSQIAFKADTSKETIPITCRIFTLTGVEEITREISVEDAKKLSELEKVGGLPMVKKLKSLGLLGEMSVEKAFSLINGEYQKRVYPEFSSSIMDNSSFNLLCFVNFTGLCMMVPPFPFGPLFHTVGIVNFLLSLGISPFLLLPLEILMILLFYIFIPYGLLFEFIGLYIPIKPALLRGYLIGNDIHLKTTGLLGTREIYSNLTAVFRMRGFTGIWITNPLTWYSWCKGFALSVYRWQ